MKISFHKNHILVISPAIVRLAGQFTTGENYAKGMAFFPFLFVSDIQYAQPWLINHELIHFRQQLETLFVGHELLSLFERLYARIVLKKTKSERYLYAASEQEAYRNQNNPDYLKHRRLWSIFTYVRDKRDFEFGKELGQIVDKD
ncbi:hypothetical protein BH11PAT2_BH11PAT2_03780 [soil metagenome]